MNSSIKKQLLVLGIILLVIVLAGIGMVVYYQNQGLVKIIPTNQDFAKNKILEIDRSKFKAPNGLSNEDFEKRIADLEKFKAEIEKDPTNYENWFVFAGIKDFLNDHEGAAGAWEEAFKLQPNDFRIPLNLGNVYQYFIKDYEKSEFNYSKALELRPDFTLAYQGLMDLYRFNWKVNQSKYEPMVLQAIAKDKTNSAMYYENLVEFFTKLDLDKAKAYFVKLKELNPTAAQKVLEDFPELR